MSRTWTPPSSWQTVRLTAMALRFSPAQAKLLASSNIASVAAWWVSTLACRPPWPGSRSMAGTTPSSATCTCKAKKASNSSLNRKSPPPAGSASARVIYGIGKRKPDGIFMTMKRIDRRTFLHHGIVLAATTPLALSLAPAGLLAQEDRSPSTGNLHGFTRSDAKVAIVRCRSYGPETRQALAKCFDLLGGISGLVKNKTVTVKLNLTGTDFSPFLGRPVGETFMTHPSTALSLGALLLAAGARRVRFVESTQSRSELASTLTLAGWDLTDFEALGPVEFENTRNLGRGKSYAHLPVPPGGRMFRAFDPNPP